MNEAWNEGIPPDHHRISTFGWVLVFVRGLILGGITFGCLGLLILVRFFERPIFGTARPITPKITKFVCRSAFFVLQIKHRVIGTPMEGMGAAVANHSSWLDIFSLNAYNEVFFVSKSEVASWPGIGWLARATGTMFVVRDRKHAKEQTQLMNERLSLGHRLLFFPEGTSTDGMQVLPFKPTLFQSFLTDDLRGTLAIQPITLRYHAPVGEDPRYYGWWGDMDFGPHLLHTLATWNQGGVDVIYHPPVHVRDFSDRKTLATALQATVAAGLSRD